MVCVIHVSLVSKSMNHIQYYKTIMQQVLELLHIDLIGLLQVESLWGKNIYLCLLIFVYVDDFSIFIWIDFMREKSEHFLYLKNYVRLSNKNDCKIVRIRSDHGKEFENCLF